MDVDAGNKLLESIITDVRKERLKKILSQRTRYVTVVLEDIYHPHNAGAVVRTAECFGIQSLHIVENENAYHDNLSTVSKGAKKWVGHHFWNTETEGDGNSSACFEHLKQQGYKIVVTTLEDKESIPLAELPLDNPIALVIGAEKKGVSTTALSMADYKLTIPMYGFTQSLNLSVCTGICLYDIVKRLKEMDIDFCLSEKEQTSLYQEWLRKSIQRPDKYGFC